MDVRIAIVVDGVKGDEVHAEVALDYILALWQRGGLVFWDILSRRTRGGRGLLRA